MFLVTSASFFPEHINAAGNMPLGQISMALIYIYSLALCRESEALRSSAPADEETRDSESTPNLPYVAAQ